MKGAWYIKCNPNMPEKMLQEIDVILEKIKARALETGGHL